VNGWLFHDCLLVLRANILYECSFEWDSMGAICRVTYTYAFMFGLRDMSHFYRGCGTKRSTRDSLPVPCPSCVITRYIMIYEVITGHQFDFTPTSGLEDINTAVQSYFASLNTE
jgi:hypothetical protein